MEYPRDKMIHELFEAQAEQTPDNVAVVFEDRDADVPGTERAGEPIGAGAAGEGRTAG